MRALNYRSQSSLIAPICTIDFLLERQCYVQIALSVKNVGRNTNIDMVITILQTNNNVQPI